MSKPVQESNQPQSNTISLEKFTFSNQILKIFREILNYNLGHFINISMTDLKQACQIELRRIQNVRSEDNVDKNIQIDNQLSLIVISNHIRAITDIQKVNEDNLKRVSIPNPKSRNHDIQQSRENLIISRYEGLTDQIQRNQSQVQKFMESQVNNKSQIDFNHCLRFFQSERKKLLLRNSSQKLISLRASLIQVITCLLSRVISKWQPATDHCVQQLGQDEYNSNNENQQPIQLLSYNEINKWSRMASRFLEEKLTELCCVCQQIPQLEIFNRTLQFSQLQSKQKVVFLKVVDVLISLHHRVSYLSRNKPQLLKELEQAQEELIFLNERCEIFLDELQQETMDLKLISFQNEARCKGQLSQGFVRLKRSISKLSEIIINQDIYHTRYLDKTDRLFQIVKLFTKVFMNGQQFLEEWEQLLQSVEQVREDNVNTDQYKLLIVLQECLVHEQNKFSTFQNLDIDSGEKTNQELSEQINKLINDYERLKDQNKHLTLDCEMFAKMREELELEIEERDNMIRNLSGVKVVLEKKLNQNQEGYSNKSNRALEDQLKRHEHDAQKYLESSLLLKEQLKVSENEREKLLQLLDDQKQKYLRTYEALNRLKLQKQKMAIEEEQLRQRIESIKNEQLRQTNRQQKQISDLTNEKHLFEMQLSTAESNNMRLMERLQLNQKKLFDYSKLMMTKLDENEPTNQKKGHTQERAQELDRIRKQLDKITLQLQDATTQKLSCDRENKILKDENDDLIAENVNLKSRLKEIKLNAEKNIESSEQLDDLKNKYERERNKAITLVRQNDVLKENQQESHKKHQANRKVIKDLESKNQELAAEVQKLRQELQRKITIVNDQRNQIATITNSTCQQIKYSKEKSNRLENQLDDKISQNQALERKLKQLEVQLSRRSKNNEETVQQLIDLKTKQYEGAIESHKIIEAKLEQQAQQLKSELSKKVEVELKLNIQIDRLSIEIDRMKELLDKYIRELTDKQQLIKIQRNKCQEQVRIIKNYEIKEKGEQHKGNYITPSQQKRLEQTPSHIDDKQYHSAINSKHKGEHSQDQANYIERQNLLSKSTARYDIYFNAREYERLLKQYNDFKATSQSKNQQLIKSLQQAAKYRAELDGQLKNLEIEYRRVLNRKNNESQLNQQSLKIKALEERLIQSQTTIKSLTEHYNQLKDINATSSKLSYQKQQIGRQLEQAISRSRQIEDQLHQTIADLTNKIVLLERELAENRFIKQVNQKIKGENHYLQDQLKKQIDLNQKNALNGQRSIEQEKLDKLNVTILQLKDQASKRETEWSRVQQAIIQVTRQRDLIRNQHDEMRRHLEEETKRAIYNEGLLASQRQEFIQRQSQQGVKDQRNLQKQIQHWKAVGQQLDLQKQNHTESQIKITYYLQKIRSLELALFAVGEELSDAKEALMMPNVPQSTIVSRVVPQYNLTVRQDNERLFQQNGYLRMEMQRMSSQSEEWAKKQKIYLHQLQSLSRQLITIKDTLQKPKSIITSMPHEIKHSNSTYSQNGIKREFRSTDAHNLLHQIQNILSGAKRWQGNIMRQSLQRWRLPPAISQQIQDLLKHHSLLVECVVALKIQNQMLNQNLLINPNLENLLEFVLRVLVYFSSIPLKSNQAEKIRAELEKISRRATGGLFFTSLQQYTVHILQNNAIEEYKRELRTKANELLNIKEQLDQLITRQIQQEESMVNRPTYRRDTTPYRDSSIANSPKPV